MITSTIVWQTGAMPASRQQNRPADKVCRRCIEQARSPGELHAIVNSEFDDCEGCAHQPVISTLVQQFQARAPHWWVVDTAVIMPIWAVEVIKRIRNF